MVAILKYDKGTIDLVKYIKVLYDGMLSYLTVYTEDVLNTNNNKTEFLELRTFLKNLLRLSSNYRTLAMHIRSYTGFINLRAKCG